MKALVYHGPGRRGWDTVDDPTIIDPTDIVVRIDTSTICGTDPHILKGDVPETTPGTVLGHEAVGTVQFADAASTKALKVVLEGSEGAPGSDDRVVAAPRMIPVCGLRAAIEMRQETI